MSSARRSSPVELRRSVYAGAPPLGSAEARERAAAPPRPSVARVIARLAIAPFAALAAAVAGLVFLVLLPICGIASLAEGFARASWAVVRGAWPPHRRGVMSQH